jgi:hypothetical protein
MSNLDIKFLIRETLELILQEDNSKQLQENVLLTEDKVSKNLQYHLDKGIPLHENAFRYGTEAQLQLFKEVRKLYNEEKLYLNPEDRWLIENTDIGNYGIYEDQFVALDVPMVEEETNPTDKITMDVPLFIRMLEYAKEDAKTDMDLHSATEQVLNLSTNGNTLTMADYDTIVGDQSLNEVIDFNFYNYVPHSFSPDTNALNKEEHEVMMKDLRKERMGLVDYIKFAGSMINNEPIYKSIFNKLANSNKKKIEFAIDQNEILKYQDETNLDPIKLQKFKAFYEKYKEIFPGWASENERLYKDVMQVLNPSLNEAKYQGKEVSLNKPKRGGSKKFYVYVKNGDKVKKVQFGAAGGGQNLAVKIRDPKARKAFASRQNCDKKKDKTTPGYWSCNIGRYWKSLGGGSNFSGYW